MARELGTEARNVTGAITSMRVDELVSNLAIGIAEGQLQLDQASMKIAEFMGEAQIAFGKKPGTDETDYQSLIELGFSPNFYQFVDTIVDVKVALSSQFKQERNIGFTKSKEVSNEFGLHIEGEYENNSKSTTKKKRRRKKTNTESESKLKVSGALDYNHKSVTATTVDAKYSSSYNYSVEASSSIKTKLVPIPAPEVFEELVRAQVAERKEEEKIKRLQRELYALIPSVQDSVDKTLANDSDLKKTKIADVNTVLSAIEVVELLEEDFERITLEHWAVVQGTVTLRKQAVNAIDKALSELESFRALVENGTATAADKTTFIGTATTELGKLKDKLTELLNKLITQRPELDEENNNDDDDQNN